MWCDLTPLEKFVVIIGVITLCCCGVALGWLGAQALGC